MDELSYRKIIDDMPIGYARHRIILDEENRPIDYQYIEVNRSFEEQTGLKREDIIGKKITEILPDIINSDFNWIEFYGEVALSGRAKEVEQYSKPLGRHYRVKTESPRHGEFITYITDITNEKKEVEEKLRLLMASSDIVIELDENYIYTDVLVEDERSLFATKGNIIGKRVDELLGDELGESVLNTLEKAKSSGKKESLVYKSIVEGDDRWFYAEIKGISYDKALKFVISVHDITEEKNLREELLKSQAELEGFFEVNLDLLCIADLEGRFIKVNREWEEILGYSREEIEGSLFFDYIHPEDLEGTLKATEELSYGSSIKGFVNRYRSKDGLYRYIEWRSNFENGYIYAAARDITDRINLETRLEEEKEFLRRMLLSIGDGVLSIGSDNRVRVINKVAKRLLGCEGSGAEGKLLGDVLELYSLEESDRIVDLNLCSPEEFGELREGLLKSKNGREYVVEYRLNNMSKTDKCAEGTIIVFRDISAQKEKQEKVEYLSYHDQLTGLYNRRFFEEELKRLDHSRNLPLSLIMIDVNGLKLTNDAFGHKAGDQLLKRISETLKRACRADDIISRVGGDEFAVILPNTYEREAKSFVGRIYMEAKKEDINHIVVSLSAGCGTKTNINENVEKALKRAEDGMYKRKLSESPAMRKKTLGKVIAKFFETNITGRKHSKDVSEIMGKFGEAMGFDAEKVEQLRMIGKVHDIGLIVLDSSTLNKSDSLSEREREEIRRHPEVGYQILRSVTHLAPIAEYVLSHHERIDGNGYPNRLKGEKIPLESRMLTIVDAYSAMTNERVYKHKLNKQEAIDELERNMGTQFDSELTRVFIDKVLKKQRAK